VSRVQIEQREFHGLNVSLSSPSAERMDKTRHGAVIPLLLLFYLGCLPRSDLFIERLLVLSFCFCLFGMVSFLDVQDIYIHVWHIKRSKQNIHFGGSFCYVFLLVVFKPLFFRFSGGVSGRWECDGPVDRPSSCLLTWKERYELCCAVGWLVSWYDLMI